MSPPCSIAELAAKPEGARLRFFPMALALALVVYVAAFHCNRLVVPETKGVVVDVVTKEPVHDAWIMAFVSLRALTIQGDVTPLISIARPHTRTGPDGTFTVPSWSFRIPPPPIAFGVSLDGYSLLVRTIDGKLGWRMLKEESLEHPEDVYAVEMRPRDASIEDDFAELQALHGYCMRGRMGFESYRKKPECDIWELDFAIRRHEAFLERIGEPMASKNDIEYVNALKRLAYLVRKRGDLEQSLELFQRAHRIDEIRGISLRIKEYETNIREIEEELRKKK